MTGQLRQLLRDALVRPSAMRLVAAAFGLLMLTIPAARPFGNVRMLACAGGLAVLATIVLSFAALPTAAGAVGIAETTIVAVHSNAFTIAVLEAVSLLAYLVVVDLATPGGVGIRSDVAKQASDESSSFLGGIALIAVVAAFTLANITGSFFAAMVGVVAAIGGIAALRWMHSQSR
ncbi:MAG: hypothetical protein ACRDV3_01595 [Acidothermaceae bacterium]